MGKRDIPWLKSQSFSLFGLCYALFLTGKAVTFQWPPWTERDGREATTENGMWKPAWSWSPWLPAQIFKLTKNWSRHVAMQMRNLYQTVLKRSKRNTAWQCVTGRNLTSSKADGQSSFTKGCHRAWPWASGIQGIQRIQRSFSWRPIILRD